jgi:hypothetical protein
VPPAEPELVIEPARGGSSSRNDSGDGKGGSGSKPSFSWDDKAVRVTSRCAVLCCAELCCAVLRLELRCGLCATFTGPRCMQNAHARPTLVRSRVSTIRS